MRRVISFSKVSLFFDYCLLPIAQRVALYILHHSRVSKRFGGLRLPPNPPDTQLSHVVLNSQQSTIMSISTLLKHSTAGVISLLGLGSLAIATPADAAVINGSFENDFNNWNTIGDVSTQTSSFGSSPTQGTSQALITNASSQNPDDFPEAAGTFNFSGNDTATVGVPGGLNDFLDIPVSSLPGSDSFLDFPQEGAALQQTFTVQAGDMLSFDWNFLTNDTANRDYAFVALDGVSQLADTTASLSDSNTAFASETGSQNFSFEFSSGGEFTLALGVVDAGDVTQSSALLVDNVQVTSQPTPVPEPLTILGSATALGFGALFKQKHSQRHKKTKG